MDIHNTARLWLVTGLFAVGLGAITGIIFPWLYATIATVWLLGRWYVVRETYRDEGMDILVTWLLDAQMALDLDAIKGNFSALDVAVEYRQGFKYIQELYDTAPPFYAIFWPAKQPPELKSRL